MNVCHFSGKVSKDLKVCGNDPKAPIVRISIFIVSDDIKHGLKVSVMNYIDCVCFDAIAISALNRYKKDDDIRVECCVKNRVYTDKNDRKVYTNDFIVTKLL